jgi:hypothetical protein
VRIDSTLPKSRGTSRIMETAINEIQQGIDRVQRDIRAAEIILKKEIRDLPRALQITTYNDSVPED